MVMNTHLRIKLSILALATCAATLLGGCGQDFDPPSLISKTRVLGAEVRVDGDPSRATPQPAETATVTFIVVAPTQVPSLGWAFVVCQADPTTNPASCAAAPLASFQGTGTPELRIAVPAAEALGNTSRLTVVGQICDDGLPAIDPQTGLPACGGAGTMVTVDVHLDRTGTPNRNPDLAARPLWIDGIAWSPDDVALDCASLPTVVAGSKEHVLRLATLAEDRETVVTPAADPANPTTTTREMLQISSFDTAGKLGQSYALVPSEDTSPESDVEIKWDAPEVPPADGRVRFYFVARDLRGGVGLATRTVCVQ
jgi:hypothetical protein